MEKISLNPTPEMKKKKLSVCHNLTFPNPNPISVLPDDVNLWYFKLRLFNLTVSEFNEFEPRLKSAENPFQFSASLNLEKLNTVLSKTNNIWAEA